jgi:ABC-type molybdate transport system substrate-binding protein
MNRHRNTMVALVLVLTLCTVMSSFVTVQTIWVFAQGNLSQALNRTGNQTANQTGNLSLSPLTPGELGGTPQG